VFATDCQDLNGFFIYFLLDGKPNRFTVEDVNHINIWQKKLEKICAIRGKKIKKLRSKKIYKKT